MGNERSIERVVTKINADLESNIANVTAFSDIDTIGNTSATQITKGTTARVTTGTAIALTNVNALEAT